MAVKFEEPKCPLCEHQFVVQISGNKYRIKGYEEMYILSTCPRCGEALFINNDYMYGIALSSLGHGDAKLIEICF